MNRWLQELPVSGAPAVSTWHTYGRIVKDWMEFLEVRGVSVFAGREALRVALSAYAGYRATGPLQRRFSATTWNQHVSVLASLGVSEENSRQLYRRARGRIDRSAGPRFQPATVPWQQLVERFLAAARDGDLPGLEQFLAEDATAWTDGGGKVSAARRAVSGRAEVARYLAGIIRRFGTGIEVMLAEVNGQPGVLGRRGRNWSACWPQRSPTTGLPRYA